MEKLSESRLTQSSFLLCLTDDIHWQSSGFRYGLSVLLFLWVSELKGIVFFKKNIFLFTGQCRFPSQITAGSRPHPDRLSSVNSLVGGSLQFLHRCNPRKTFTEQNCLVWLEAHAVRQERCGKVTVLPLRTRWQTPAAAHATARVPYGAVPLTATRRRLQENLDCTEVDGKLNAKVIPLSSSSQLSRLPLHTHLPSWHSKKLYFF